MPYPSPFEAVLTGLRAALSGSVWGGVALELLADKGLAHHHVRLCGSGLLARIPKQSQMRLNAEDNLAYLAACFARCSASGHVPAMAARLPVSKHLPRGALLVQEVMGVAAQLPRDMAAIAGALAAIHHLPLPTQANSAPLQWAADPLAALLQEVQVQAVHLPAAQLAPGVLERVQAQLNRLEAQCAQPLRPPRCLIAFDAHPGNFLMQGERAILVDLEKCRYSYAGLDLAHATLYTSTTWDTSSHAVLSHAQVLAAYAAWAQAVGPATASAAQAWHAPLRRAMWLWSISWCAQWRALSAAPAGGANAGQDWSGELSSDALTLHVRERVDHYLSAETVHAVCDGLDGFEEAMR